MLKAIFAYSLVSSSTSSDWYLDGDEEISHFQDYDFHSYLLQTRSSASSSVSKVPIPMSQRNALQDLWESLDGPNWEYTNTATLGRAWDMYNSSSDPCIDEWYGVGCSCNGKQNHSNFDDDSPFQYYESFDDDAKSYPQSCNVTLLVLKDINLDGQIPSSIGSISTLQQLLLSGTSMYGRIPSSIGNLSALEYLCTNRSSLSGAVPESISSLRLLTYLSLSNSRFTSVPSNIGNLVHLQKLKLDNNSLTDLPDSIGNLKSLTALNLSRNYLTTIPSSIGKLVYLRALLVANNSLISIPDSIGNLTSLEALILFDNSLTSIPYSIGNLINLRILRLSYNSLTYIPDSIGYLVNLQLLFLTANSLAKLPQKIWNLQNLTMLYMSINSLSYLSDSIGNLVNLQVFAAADNFLLNLPKSIGNLNQLYLLDLENNYLVKLPNEIGHLHNLTLLKLSNNLLTYLPSDPLSNFTNLVYMDISSNKLNGLPDSFAHLTSLKYLRLGNNKLRSLPDCITRLENLEYLSAENMNFTNDDITNLTGLNTLQRIILKDNRLTSIPPLLLENIYELDVSNNSIRSNLDFIKNMTSLTALYISYNAFTGTIPDELYEKGDLQVFAAGHNFLTGTISSRFANSFKNLLFWNVENNRLSGNLPSFYSSFIANTKFISFGKNEFTGPFPKFNCSSTESNALYYVDLQDNELYGEFDLGVFNCTNLWRLDLSDNNLHGNLPDKFDMLGAIRHLYLDGNTFTGTLPKTLSSCYLLEELWLQGNRFVGPVPSLRNMTKLSQLFLQGNQFDGSLQFIDPLSNSGLCHVDVSNNNFEGYVDLELFSLYGLKNLISFAASANCLTIKFSQAICNSTSLQTLILDGVHTSESCREKIGLNIQGEGAYRSVQSVFDVPACIYGMNSLQTLHLSGNGITGSLPHDIKLSSSMVELILSHNEIRGAIPEVMQRHPWHNLDLSYNKISGTLMSDLAASKSLTLCVNRLSEKIPLSFYSMPHIDILNGNFLNCDQKQLSSLSDPSSDVYTCGSGDVNEVTIILIALTAVAFLLPLAFKYLARLHSTSRNFLDTFNDYTNRAFSILSALGHLEDAKKSLQESTGATIDTTNINDMLEFLQNIRKVSIVTCLSIVLVYLPIYSSLGIYYKQYSTAYIYTVSMAYLSGVIPGIIVFIVLVAGLAAMRLAMELFYRASTSIRAKKSSPFRVHIAYNVLICFLAAINTTIVLAASIAYFLTSATSGFTLSNFLSILLALFKVIWTSLVIPKVLKSITSMYISRFNFSNDDTLATENMRTLVDRLKQKNSLFAAFASIFNYVVAPFIVVFFQSPKCFFNIITVNSDIVSFYVATYCTYTLETFITFTDVQLSTLKSYKPVEDIGISSCSTETLTPSVSYQPPYSYTYECSSNVLASFVKVFFIQCIFVTIAKPFLQLASVLLYDQRRLRIFRLLREIDIFPLPVWATLHNSGQLIANENTILERIEIRRQSSVSISFAPVVFSSESFISEIFSLVALLFSLGVIFPPLGVALTVSIISLSYVIQLQLGYFLQHALDIKSPECISILNLDLRFITVSFYKSVSASYAFSTVLASFFIFDIIGDETGYKNAMIAASLFALMSIIIFFCAPQIFTRQSYLRIKRSFVAEADIELISREVNFMENPMRSSMSRPKGSSDINL